MAGARECPACGHRHRLESIPDSATFRCEQCGQILKAPSPVSSQPGAPPPPARGSAAPARTGAPPVAPPRRRTEHAPTDDGATRTAPVRTAAGVSATVAATAAADQSNGAAPAPGRRGRRSASTPPTPKAAPAPRAKVHWYWRLVAWIVAVPLAFVVTAW